MRVRQRVTWRGLVLAALYMVPTMLPPSHDNKFPVRVITNLYQMPRNGDAAFLVYSDYQQPSSYEAKMKILY
jgi:hypothetical protein